MTEQDETQQRLAQFQQEQLNYKEACTNGMWEELTEENFPLTVAAHPRPFWSNKLDLIAKEEERISNNVLSAGGDKDTTAILRGRMRELTKAASETIHEIYPHVEPVENQTSVQPETFKAIDAFVKEGAIEQLNEKNIPGWDSLSADQRLLYRLQALQIYSDMWEGVKDDDTLDEGNPVGFGRQASGKFSPSRTDQIAKLVKEKIIERHLPGWVDEAIKQGLSEDDEVVIQARKAISPNK